MVEEGEGTHAPYDRHFVEPLVGLDQVGLADEVSNDAENELHNFTMSVTNSLMSHYQKDLCFDCSVNKELPFGKCLNS